MSSLDQIAQELKGQTSTLEETKNAIKDMLAEDIAARKKAERASGKEEERRRETAQKSSSEGPKGFMAGLKTGVAESTGIGFLQRWSSAIMTGLFGGATAATLAGAIGRLVSRGVIFGGAAALVGAFGEDLFKALFNELDPGDFIGQDFKDNFASSLADAAKLGTLGLIFGRRIGLALFAGSLIGDGIKSLFDTETLNTKFFEGFGASFDVGDIVTYGSMIAAFFGPAMIGNALHSNFTGAKFDPKSNRWRSPYGGYMSEANAKAFNKQFRPKMSFGGRVGWAAVIGVAGATLAGFISNHVGEGMGEATSWGITGASLGMMFGPQGAILGAIAGFALAGGAKVFEYLKEVRERNLDKIKGDIDRLQKEAEALAAEGDLEGASQLLATAGRENLRLGELDSKNAVAADALEIAKGKFEIAQQTQDRNDLMAASQELFAAALRADIPDEAERLRLLSSALNVRKDLMGIDTATAYERTVAGLGMGIPTRTKARELKDQIISMSNSVDGTTVSAIVEELQKNYENASGVTINYNNVDNSSSNQTAVSNENKTFASTPVGYDRLDQVMTSRMMRQYAGFRIGGRQF